MSNLISDTVQSTDQQIIQELQARKLELERKQLVDTALNEFNDLMLWRPDDKLDLWAERLLDALSQKLPLLQAVLYSSQYKQEKLTGLEWVGAFAYDAESKTEIWKPGEGLVGQAAESKRRFFVEDGVEIPVHQLGNSLNMQPVSLWVEPLIYNDRTEGVLEMTFFAELQQHWRELIQVLGRSLAANLMSLRNQQEMRRLYAEMQQKTEAIVSQEEEMRQNLEEMQATQEELKRTKDEVEKRQNIFEGIAQNVPGMLYQYFLDFETGNHGFIYVSSRSNELFGVEPSYFTGSEQNSLEAHPDEEAQFQQLILESAQNITPYKWRGRFKHPVSRDYFWLEAHSTPKKMSETQVFWDGYLHVIEDQIERETELKSIHVQLEEQKAILSSMIDNMSQTIVAIDTDFNLLFVNKVVSENYKRIGIEIEYGTSVWNLIPPDQKDFYENAYKRAFEGDSFNILNHYQMDELDIQFSIDYYPLQNGEGRIIGAVASAINLNDNKDFDAKAQFQLHMTQVALDLLSTRIFGLDAQHNLYQLNTEGNWEALEDTLTDWIAETDKRKVENALNSVSDGENVSLQNIQIGERNPQEVHLWIAPNSSSSGISGISAFVMISGISDWTAFISNSQQTVESQIL